MTEDHAVFGPEEIERIRRETPGLGRNIHLDNCGASLMTQPVVESMKSFLDSEVSLGGYVAQEQQLSALSGVYESLSQLFGGTSDNYALTSSAVDAWTKAFYSIPMSAGDNIVTMYNEYCSNYVACLHRAEVEDVEIRVARSDAEGRLDLEHLSDLIDERTRVVSVTHVATSSGQVADVARIGEIVKDTSALYLLDSCQAAGHVEIDFPRIGCHLATATSRKFLRGPRGVGFLYASDEALQQVKPAMLTNQSASWDRLHTYSLLDNARVFEDWERSCMLHLGFGAALDYLLKQNPTKVYDHLADTAKNLRKNLYSLPNIIPTCLDGAEGAIITFNVKDKEAATVRAQLADNNITAQVSSVYHTRWDFEARGIETAVRVSPHYYNDDKELDTFLDVVGGL